MVVDVNVEENYKSVKVAYRRFHENGDMEDSRGNKYFGLDQYSDEWFDVLSPRIQAQDKMTDAKQWSSMVLDEGIEDFYDSIF